MQRFVSNRFFVARLLVIFSTALILAGCHPWDDDDDPDLFKLKGLQVQKTSWENADA